MAKINEYLIYKFGGTTTEQRKELFGEYPKAFIYCKSKWMNSGDQLDIIKLKCLVNIKSNCGPWTTVYVDLTYGQGRAGRFEEAILKSLGAKIVYICKHSLVFDVRENGKVEFVRCQICDKRWKTITTKRNGRWIKETTVIKEGMESP